MKTALLALGLLAVLGHREVRIEFALGDGQDPQPPAGVGLGQPVELLPLGGAEAPLAPVTPADGGAAR